MPLIELVGASVWLEGHEILHHLHWRLEPGAHFAVLGGNGAGKSTFLRLLAGQLWPRPHHSRLYHWGEKPTWSPLRARENIALLSPEIQERFVRQLQDGPDNEKGWQLDARTAILTGYYASELLHQMPSGAQQQRADQLIAFLKLEELAHRQLQTLSQGQMRRVLLARALVSNPELLLLDEACSGLDAPARQEMLELIEAIAQSGETTIGLTTHRDSEIVPSIRQILTFAHGQLIAVGAPAPSPASPEVKPQAVTSGPAGETLLKLKNVAVFLDGTPILHGLNWQLKRGQHFAIEGGNGAGKTTFLRLLRGELWPARGGEIERFGSDKPQPRAVIGRQISLLSPALQARYSDEISVETAVASGWFDSFGRLGEMSEAMRQQTQGTIEFCGLSAFASRNFARLSYGQRRRVLLARALVTNPQILLLDEALDGLDAASRAQWHGLLAAVAARGTSLVVTSHHEGDYPPFLTHSLRLEKGKIVQQKEFSS